MPTSLNVMSRARHIYTENSTTVQYEIDKIYTDIDNTNTALNNLKLYAEETYLKKAGDSMTGKLTANSGFEATNMTGTNLTLSNYATIGGIGIGLSSSVKVIKDVTNITADGTVTSPSFVGELTGNSSSATKLKTARTISIANHATGSASFDGTKDISISITLADSGVTANTYGPSADVSGTNGSTIKVPEISVDRYGRVTKVTDRTYTSVDTHWTTGLVVGNTSSVTSNVAATNGNVYLVLKDDSTVRASHLIKGTGTTSVTSDSNGVITIDSIVYKNGTGLTLDGSTFNHTDSITAGTAGDTSAVSPDYGSTFTTPYIKYNSTGHITSVGTRNVTIPTVPKLVVNTASTSTSNGSSSSDVYLNLVTGTTVRSYNKISGTGNITVSSDANGNITITGLTATGGTISSGLTKLYADEGNNTDGAMTQKSVKSSLDNIRDNYLKLAGGTMTGTITSRDITPSANNTYSLGTSSMKFNNVYATTFNGALSGNASTASTWQTTRTLTIGNTGKSVNGGSNVSWSLSEIGALPTAGGTMTGTLNARDIAPSANNTYSLGTSSAVWANVYATTFNGALSGNASTASKWQTARSLTIGSSSKSVDGSSDVSFTLAEIGAVKAVDGTATNLSVSTSLDVCGGMLNVTNYGITTDGDLFVSCLLPVSSSDHISIPDTAAQNIIPEATNTYSLGTSNKRWSEIYVGTIDTQSISAKTMTSAVFNGTLSGNASTATKLATARTITIGSASKSFDGSGDISFTLDDIGASSTNASSASKWQTARTITIGNTGKSVDGSADVSWTLSEIGAAAASHNHTSLTVSSIYGNEAWSADSKYLTINDIVRFSGASFAPDNMEYNCMLGMKGYVWKAIYGRTLYTAYNYNTNYEGNLYYGEINCTGISADRTYTLPDATGTIALTTSNVSTASKLYTARNITIGNATKSFDGSAAISFTLDEIGSSGIGKQYTVNGSSTNSGNLYGEVFNNLNANAASGIWSHAEGSGTTASGIYSHAEGYSATASGSYSHAEGYSASSSAFASHAEGMYTIASGSYSHAEGYGTIASGEYSHAEGLDTKAAGNYQHVSGKYNVSDTTSAVIVGGGTSNTAGKNIYTLDWSGNIEIPGSYKVSQVAQADISSVYDNVRKMAIVTSESTVYIRTVSSGERGNSPYYNLYDRIKLSLLGTADSDSTYVYEHELECGCSTDGFYSHLFDSSAYSLYTSFDTTTNIATFRVVCNGYTFSARTTRLVIEYTAGLTVVSTS